MAIVDRTSARIVATSVVLGLLIAACDTAPDPSAPSRPPSEPSPRPTSTPATRTGGTLYLLTHAEQWNHVDPQRIYTPEDTAFFGATLYRSLVAYKASPDPVEGTSLTPDLATDLGRPSDGGRTWAFTLRDGATFQTGDPITCEDIRYGVSRTFANTVISEGPTYSIQYLDVPPARGPDIEAGFLSSYHGPYESTPAQQASFDEAVECSPDHRTIMFHLNRPIADFNYTTTLGFSPVPKAADTGETYGTYPDQWPVSSGPYMVESYTTGVGGRFVLVRNPSWNAASDLIRAALPDRWEVEFAVDPLEIDRRMIAAEGDDAFAIQHLQPASIAAFTLADGTIDPAIASRLIDGLDPYSRYYWIDVEKVPNLKVRQAMLVALDREAIRAVYGGDAYATFADGVIKPTIGQDYAPTGIWDTFFGTVVPPTGDPELAKRLLRESGERTPQLKIEMVETPTNQKVFPIIQRSLSRAGFSVEFVAACTGYGCGIIFDPKKKTDFGTSGWGHDWPNASTVIPALFTQQGGWDLSGVDDPAFNAAVNDALTTLDRGEQARKWQELNKQAVENAWVIPTFWGRDRRLAGSKVGPIYQWPAYASWPYRELHLVP